MSDEEDDDDEDDFEHHLHHHGAGAGAAEMYLPNESNESSVEGTYVHYIMTASRYGEKKQIIV